jgi:hypothetical protein
VVKVNQWQADYRCEMMGGLVTKDDGRAGSRSEQICSTVIIKKTGVEGVRGGDRKGQKKPSK